MNKSHTIYILPATLILAFGLFFGSALSIASTIGMEAVPISTAQPVSDISTPAPVKTEIVRRTVNVPPSNCTLALEKATTAFTYSSKRAEQYTTALDHLSNYDWYEARAALRTIKKLNKKIDKLYPQYTEARVDCNGDK